MRYENDVDQSLYFFVFVGSFYLGEIVVVIDSMYNQ